MNNNTITFMTAFEKDGKIYSYDVYGDIIEEKILFIHNGKNIKIDIKDDCVISIMPSIILGEEDKHHCFRITVEKYEELFDKEENRLVLVK